jgi:hypothetical protein
MHAVWLVDARRLARRYFLAVGVELRGRAIGERCARVGNQRGVAREIKLGGRVTASRAVTDIARRNVVCRVIANEPTIGEERERRASHQRAGARRRARITTRPIELQLADVGALQRDRDRGWTDVGCVDPVDPRHRIERDAHAVLVGASLRTAHQELRVRGIHRQQVRKLCAIVAERELVTRSDRARTVARQLNVDERRHRSAVTRRIAVRITTSIALLERRHFHARDGEHA